MESKALAISPGTHHFRHTLTVSSWIGARKIQFTSQNPLYLRDVTSAASVFSSDDTASRWLLSQDAAAHNVLSGCRCTAAVMTDAAHDDCRQQRVLWCCPVTPAVLQRRTVWLFVLWESRRHVPDQFVSSCTPSYSLCLRLLYRAFPLKGIKRIIFSLDPCTAGTRHDPAQLRRLLH
jgi:hypothetical protein